MQAIPMPITKEYMLQFLREHNSFMPDVWNADIAGVTTNPIYRELILICWEIEKDVGFDNVETFNCQLDDGDDGILNLPDVFTHRLGQRYYTLVIRQLDYYLEHYYNSSPTVSQEYEP